MAVSKRLRYEVLRRDNHSCRYCGATAPDAKLTIDHVVPVALGGSDDANNLVTACGDCNAGKSSSSPDAPIVDDVAADALRWARAMQTAAAVAKSQRDYRDADRRRFLDEWESWTYASKNGRETFPLPLDWQAAIDRFGEASLPSEEIADAVDIAMRARGVYFEKIFAYFCGVCYRKIQHMQEIAQQVLASEESE